MKLRGILLFWVLLAGCGGVPLRMPAADVLQSPQVLYEQAIAHGEQREFAQMGTKLSAAADQGHLPSQLLLCSLYANDLGPPNYAQGLYWCRRAAEQEDAEAMRMVAYYFAQGMGVTANQADAIVWYREAVAHGSAEAMFDLARRYETGDGVAQDVMRAAELYRAAADKGNPAAKQNLHNIEKYGAALIAKVILPVPGLNEARAGDPEAQFRVGMIFLTGHKYLLRSAAEALFWLARARQGGHAQATRLLERFEARRSAADAGLEFPLLQIAADAGEPEAMYALGVGHLRGVPDIHQDVSLGIEWLTKAANAGHGGAAFERGFHVLAQLYAIAPSQDRIPDSIERKAVVEQCALAQQYLQMAVDRDEPLGWYGLGSLLAWEFSERNLPAWRRIAEFDRKASQRGVLPSTVRLVESLLRGRGMERDYREAARLLETNLVWAPEYPYLFAYYGEVLLKGYGVPVDPVRGIAYLERAADYDVTYVCVILRDYYYDQGSPEALRKAFEWEDRCKRGEVRR